MSSPFHPKGKIKIVIIKTFSDMHHRIRGETKRKVPLKPEISLDMLLLLGKDSEKEQTTHDRCIIH